MRSTRSVLFFSALATLVLSAALGAQGVQMGTDVSTPNSTDTTIVDLHTDIDLVRPATATGLVDTATFQLSEFGCGSEVMIKFFRRQGDTLVYLTERGPFDASDLRTVVSLVPPVAVEEGDLIGVSNLTMCGVPSTLSGIVSAGFVAYSGDVVGNVGLGAATATSGDILAVSATGTATESITRVIPAAGSTPGSNSSFFKTAVQLFNPFSETISGRFVYHPAGVSGSSTDPSVTFTVGASQSVSYPDLVATLGGSGLGSIDVVMPAGSSLPVIVTRVFNDAGTSGTSGFTEDAISPEGVGTDALLFAGSTGFLIAPADTVKFRFNMGVRTFLSGAFITLKVHDASGAVVHTTTKTYLPTYFEQQSSDSFLGYILQPNQTIEISVSSGSAVVYGATTDNITNDPAIQFARVAFAIL